MVGGGGWEGWFDSYIKYQRKEYHFNCQMAYWYISTYFEYWALKLLKDKASKCVRNTGNDWVLGWHRSEIILLGELPGNINGKYYSWGRKQSGSDFYKPYSAPLPEHSDSHCFAWSLKGRWGWWCLWSMKITRYKGGDGTETMLLWVRRCTCGKNNCSEHIVSYFQHMEEYKWSNEAGDSDDLSLGTLDVTEPLFTKVHLLFFLVHFFL